MVDDSTTQCLLFPEVLPKPVVARFDHRQGSSDGGAILLKAAERQYGLIACLASCLQDERQPGKIDHSLEELLAQRVFSIACGYPDAKDAARLAADPIHKMLLDRDPIEGTDLASQPTLSRFENAVGRKDLYRLSEALAASVLRRHAQRLRGRVRRVTLDLDPTDDPTHGAQQRSFFNGHYDTWCYLPVMGFVSFNEEAEQYLCAAVWRPGNVTSAVGAVGILRRLRLLIRHSSWRAPSRAARWWLCASRRVRLSGGRAQPRIPGGDGQKCGAEAQGQTSDAPRPQTLPAEWRDRTRLRRSVLCSPELAATTPPHPQGRGRPGRWQTTERQSALRYHPT